jgi:hypothetical protein
MPDSSAVRPEFVALILYSKSIRLVFLCFAQATSNDLNCPFKMICSMFAIKSLNRQYNLFCFLLFVIGFYLESSCHF